MKNSLFVTSIIVIVIVGAGVWLASSNNNNNKYEKEGLPQSLDQYYMSKPPAYLINMFELGEALMGIGVNMQQGEMANAKKSFNDFSEKYKDSSNLVPEWNKYYDVDMVKKLGSSLDSGNASEVFESLGKVGAKCAACHKENMPNVWNRYNWNDFSKMTLNTPNPDEPVLPWSVAKIKYMAPGFDGIGVNIKNGNQKGAQQSFSLFKAMFENMNSTCLACHAYSPRYYVSADIRGMIDAMGENIDSGNLEEAERLRKGIGMESCYRCHVLHLPAQFAKIKNN